MPKYEVYFEQYVQGKRMGVSVIEADNEAEAKGNYWDGDIKYYGTDLVVNDTWFADVKELDV